MQFKKIAAIAGSAIMAGLTIATPVLGATVSQVGKISDLVTVEDSTVAFPTFVVGANALTSDVAGAINVAVRMAANAKTTEMVSVEGGVGTSVTGGVELSTSGDKITPGTSIGAVKSVLTISDLPTVLATNTFQTATGSNHEYKQYLYVDGNAAHKVVFEKPLGEDEPRLSLKIATGQKLYEYQMTFSTPVTGITSQITLDDKIKGQTLNILGKDFVVSEAVWGTAQIDSITILGGKNTVTVGTGEDATIDDWTVHLDAVVTENVGAGSYTAVGDVNGEAFSIAAGSTYTMKDGTVIAAIKVWQGKTGESDYAKITIGADKIKLPASGSITKGSSIDSTVDSLITSSDTAGWSALKLTYTPDDNMWAAEGTEISDAFADTFAIQFAGIVPSFESTSRQMIEFLPDGQKMTLKYENAGGVEYTMPTMYFTTPTAWTWTDGSGRAVIFDENSTISGVNKDFFVIQKAGFSHVMQFMSLTNTTPTLYELSFKDESGNTVTSSANTANTPDGKLILDGNEFGYNIVDHTNKLLVMDLNGNTTINTAAPGIATTYLVPKLIQKDKGGLYFYKGNATNTTVGGFVDNGLGEVMPDGSGGPTLLTGSYGAANAYVWLVDAGANALTAPGFVLVQEGMENANVHNWIYLPVAYDTTKAQTYVTSTASDDALYTRISITGSSGEYKAMTAYGSLVHELGLNNGGDASISYPDEYVYANVYVLEPEGAVTSATQEGDVESDKVLTVTADVAKLDSEITDKTASDFILVGGPCVNTLVAELADEGKFAYTCDTWPGENFGWIQLLPDAYAEGKTVLIIAGTRAQDTDLAARVVQDGTKLAGKTGSSAKVTGESFASVVVA